MLWYKKKVMEGDGGHDRRTMMNGRRWDGDGRGGISVWVRARTWVIFGLMW